jgi:hypothetical protein
MLAGRDFDVARTRRFRAIVENGFADGIDMP